MIKKTMKVRENTFRKLEDPFENGAAKKYVFYVKVDDVAEGIPMATNPRDQKLTSGVATAIKESLLSNDGYFHLKNRGIVLSAESVHYNNKEKIATITFSDELSHGNIDGGHTYKIVCEHKGENLEQYVQFEVMTGVEDIIENLAEARNTSVEKLTWRQWQDILDRVGNREDERIFQWLKQLTEKIREDDWREFEKALHLYLKDKDTSVFDTEELFAIYDSIMLMSIRWREQFKLFAKEHPKSAKIKSKGTWVKKYYALCFKKKKELHSQVVTDAICTSAFSELM